MNGSFRAEWFVGRYRFPGLWPELTEAAHQAAGRKREGSGKKAVSKKFASREPGAPGQGDGGYVGGL